MLHFLWTFKPLHDSPYMKTETQLWAVPGSSRRAPLYVNYIAYNNYTNWKNLERRGGEWFFVTSSFSLLCTTFVVVLTRKKCKIIDGFPWLLDVQNWPLGRYTMHSGSDNLKKSRQKNWEIKYLNQKIFFVKLHFWQF